MGMGMDFTDIFDKLREAFADFAELIRSHIRTTLLIAAAVLFVILVLIVLSVWQPAPEKKLPDTEPAPDYALPLEDFFLPYEPDFVPGVLLEREPRDSWTEEDARPFWTDPMDGNEELWRKRIESGIDVLLEQVP
jgi:hypothetical protein